VSDDQDHNIATHEKVSVLSHLLALRKTDLAAVTVALTTVENAMRLADALSEARHVQVKEMRNDLQNISKDIIVLQSKLAEDEGTTAGRNASWLMIIAVVGALFGLISSVAFLIRLGGK
jgi:hypothetical protein